MLKLDIVFVTYNSEKWIEPCFRTLAASQADLSGVSVYVVDNASSDNTVEKLREAKLAYGNVFGAFEIESSGKNLGFGAGNNLGAKFGKAPCLFFLNIDTEVYPDTLEQLMNQVQADWDSDFALWELRQLPYEHPKDYNILTGETSWASGAAFAIRREMYERIGGFDERIFMYGEDVDLSWRVRAEGARLRYVPKAAVQHFSYQKAGVVKPGQFIYSAVYNQLLRSKFGGAAERAEGCLWLALKLIKGAPFKGSRTALLRTYVRCLPVIRDGRRWGKENAQKLKKQRYTFYAFNYELERVGAFVPCARPTYDKKVSVIVRTCGRPAVLRETLCSLRAQTYPNMEVVIVEDGPNVSEDMIRTEFADLDIVYQATGEKRGRCVNGNIAMQLATGDYLNFLDDDDLFYADHIETLVNALEQNPQYRVAYSMGFETPVDVHSRDPYRYDVRDIRTVCSAAFSLQEILCHNIAPIQAVMFERGVFEECGGLDEGLEMMEDWDLWVRYALKYPFLFVPKTTSVYRVPAGNKVNAERAKAMDAAFDAVRLRYIQYDTGSQSIKARLLRDRRNSGLQGMVFKGIRGAYRMLGKAKHMLRRRMGRTV